MYTYKYINITCKIPPKTIPLIDNHGHGYSLFTSVSILWLRSRILIDPLIKPSAIHLEHIYKTLKMGCARDNRMSRKTNNLSDDLTSQVKFWPPALYQLPLMLCSRRQSASNISGQIYLFSHSESYWWGRVYDQVSDILMHGPLFSHCSVFITAVSGKKSKRLAESRHWNSCLG